jgi:hypothetical protein
MYNNAQNELSDIVNRLESASGFQIRELTFRLERIDQNIKYEFARGVNDQATIV